MTIELIMQVSRSAENRLSGSVRSGLDSELHHFSGTLELMRVFEDLVPLVPEAGASAAPGAVPRTPRPAVSESPNPKSP